MNRPVRKPGWAWGIISKYSCLPAWICFGPPRIGTSPTVLNKVLTGDVISKYGAVGIETRLGTPREYNQGCPNPVWHHLSAAPYNSVVVGMTLRTDRVSKRGSGKPSVLSGKPKILDSRANHMQERQQVPQSTSDSSYEFLFCY